MDELTALTLEEFTARLASRAATPGGGGASALGLALAASLGAMAAGLSEKNQAQAVSPVCREAEELRLGFLRLIKADAEGFAPLAAAYSLEKNDPRRAETLREATLTACRAPLEMLRLGARTAALLEGFAPLCKRLLLSDLGCAALFAEGALQCAAMNLFVNTRTLPQDSEARAMAEEAETILSESLPRLRTISERVMAFLREVRADG